MNDREEAIFHEAREIPSPEDRARYLAQACGDDRPFRERMERLLAADDSPATFLNRPAAVALRELLPDPTDAIPATSIAPPPYAPLEGVLGDFALVREIGRGGMGVVYEARQISLNRKVALKILPFAAVLDQRQLKRFETEATAAAGLHHGNIVPVYQISSDRAVHFYAMQYIEGRDVAELIVQLKQLTNRDDDPPSRADFDLASGLAAGHFAPTTTTPPGTSPAADNLPASPSAVATRQSTVDTHPFAALSTRGATSRLDYFRTIAHLGIQAAEALEFAHRRGILHRDIKPSNLMLDADGKLWITDFGLARIDGNADLTLTGDVMGTLRYMSPEQALGQRDGVDQRSDVYSLGATLYEMLVLTPIYPATNRHELLQKRQHEEPVPLRLVNPAIPVDLETIVHKAIARDPADRYLTAQEFADDLRRFLNHEPIQARRVTLSARAAKWAHRNRVIAMTFAAAFLGGVVAASMVVMLHDRDGHSASPGRSAESTLIPVRTGTGAPQAPPHREERPARDPLAGILPHPPKIPGIGRWQIISTRPVVAHIDSQFQWHPDGRFIALGDGPNLLIVEADRFELSNVFCGHTSDITNVDWSPDGEFIASASRDGTVRIWNVANGTPGTVLVGHAGEVVSVSWHPDGRRLASGDRDGHVRIWTTDGHTLANWQAHGQGLADLDWNLDGTSLASTGSAGTIALWNDQGERQSVIDPENHESQLIAWNSDGTRLLTANVRRKEVCIWDRDGTQRAVLSGLNRTPISAAWSPDGNHIASVDSERTLRLWDIESDTTTVVDIGINSWQCVEFSPDGESLAILSGDGFYTWDKAGRPLAVHRTAGNIRRARLSPDGERLAINIGGGEIFHLLLCNADGSQPQILDDLIGYPLDFDWTPDSQAVLAGGGQPSLRICNRDGSAGLVFDEDPNWDRGVRRLAISPDGKLAAVHVEDPTGTGAIRIWNLDGTPGPICPGPVGVVKRPAWSPDGSRIAAHCWDDRLHIWTADGQPELSLPTGGVRGSSDIFWKPDGTDIAILNGDAMRVWNMEGKQLALLQREDIGTPPWEWASSTSSEFSDDYSAGPSTTIRFTDPQTGRLAWILAVAPDEQVVKFGPDGRVLDGQSDVVDLAFAYIIEKPTGAIELVKPSDFARRYFDPATERSDGKKKSRPQ